MQLHDMKYAVSGDADLYNYLLAHSYRPNEHLEGLHKVPKLGIEALGMLAGTGLRLWHLCQPNQAVPARRYIEVAMSPVV